MAFYARKPVRNGIARALVSCDCELLNCVRTASQRGKQAVGPEPRGFFAVALAASLLVISGVVAGADENAAAQANNPLAKMTALVFHNYYIGSLTESDDDANQLWVRFAKPFGFAGGNWLLRASLPLNSFPTPPDADMKTGLGDLNLFTAYLVDTGNPAINFGVGPMVTAPTASEQALGSEKWSGGLVNILFNATSPRFQYGYLVTWQASFAGDDDRSNVNVAALQPFAFYQLGGGHYIRAAPIWAYNFENDNYSMPLALGYGKVIKKRKTVFNFFVEPQFSVADRGPGQPEWQIFAGVNMQFFD